MSAVQETGNKRPEFRQRLRTVGMLIGSGTISVGSLIVAFDSIMSALPRPDAYSGSPFAIPFYGGLLISVGFGEAAHRQWNRLRRKPEPVVPTEEIQTVWEAHRDRIMK